MLQLEQATEYTLGNIYFQNSLQDIVQKEGDMSIP